MAELVLRPATEADAGLVHGWANDPHTRAASFSTAEIPLAEHLRWFARELARADHHLFMAEHDGEPVGFVRLDEQADPPATCTISINMAPSSRGRGLGLASLRATAETARLLGLRAIHALVRPDNLASVHAFERAGFARTGETVVANAAARIYVLTLPS